MYVHLHLERQDDIDYLWTSIKNGWLKCTKFPDHCGFQLGRAKHMGKDDFKKYSKWSTRS